MLSEHVPDLSTFSESDLFSLYRAILSELKSRGVIRTENAPVGDYAEYLVATALGGQLAPNSEKSWDVLGNDGEKLQVKARVVSEPAEPGQLQLSPFRSFGFDSAVIVLLSAADYAVSRASKVPRHVVESSAIYREHVNGKVLFARPEIMGHPDALDLTAVLRRRRTGRQTVRRSREDSMSAVIQPQVEGRIRRAIPDGAGVLSGSLPVVSFGDPGTAAVATASLNPSWREFQAPSGEWLLGGKRRLASLHSMRVKDPRARDRPGQPDRR